MTADLHEQPTHYQVLGIPPSAVPAEIRAVYRALAKKLHPDADSSAGSEARFASIARAYEVLIEEKSRRAYDAQLQREAERQRRMRNGVDLRPHFHWQNIAAPQGSATDQSTHEGSTPEGFRSGVNEARAGARSDFDTLYDTFFGSTIERERGNQPPSSVEERKQQ